MFPSLPSILRSYGVPADVRTLLLLRRAMDKGLVKTLGDIYLVLKSIVVKDASHRGPFTMAYYDYFLQIEIQTGETLDEAITRSITFQKWKEKLLQDHPERSDELSSLINQFLDEVHLTSYDIKQIVDGKEILEKDDPDQLDEGEGNADATRRSLDKAADYTGVDLEEILRRMERVRQQQSSRHSGGSHWLGTGGISPYGHSGAAKGGIRLGGSGGGKMARKVFDNPRYFPVDLDSKLKDDNIDAALASLKGVIEDSTEAKLDVDKTIKDGLKRGGLYLPEMKNIYTEKMQIILLIDNGGYSMDGHIGVVTELFKKMKTRFAHDLKVYYFHNTIYNVVYSDPRRSKPVTVKKLTDHDKNYKVFIIGDAAMAPYELNRNSINHWTLIKDKFRKIAWLNPDSEKYWTHTQTTAFLMQMFDMYPLSPKGIEQAVRNMNRKTNEMY